MTSAIDRVPCLVAVPFLFVSLAQGASAQETAKGLLAAQARAQGYRCEKPISAKKDAKRSRPDAAFWVLRCERNSYTMRLTPDMAAHIQRLK
jgi:outer membrane lipoprotein-sorting protein